MPRAWAAMVIRVWSRVASAVLKPVPGSPMIRFGRDAGVFQDDGPGGGALDAELLLRLAEADPGVGLLYHEGGDAASALGRVGHRHHRVELRHPGVADPHLGAVEHPLVAVADRAGLHRAGVRAGARLGQRVGEHRLAPGDRRQVGLLEFFRGRQQQRDRAELVDRRDQR